jgi:tRNA A37 threonylcarbamoyladenosine dehydratase
MKQANSSTNAAVTGFLLGSAVTALVTHYLFSPPKQRTNNGKQATTNTKSKEIIIPPEIRSEQLSRNELYFGAEGMESIKNASILIVGLGGVGSHTAHMLARAGVGYMRFVDFDQVTLSSLNRHACATLEDVGIAKVTCLKRFLYKICGNCCEIDARAQMYTGDDSKDGDMMTCPAHVSNGKWDLVIDAIDDVPTKARLLIHCAKNGIRAIASGSAGGKSDMTRLHISDLRSASKDPLVSKLRQVLKRMMKADKDFKDLSLLEDVDKLAILFSSEKVVVKLADFTEEQKKEGIQNFGAVDGMRIRVIPVLGTMPAIMGQSLAGMALCEIGGKPFTPSNGERVGRNIRHKLFQHYKNREKVICDKIEIDLPEATRLEDENYDTSEGRQERVINGTWVGPPQIDSDDVEYILSEVWRNRCCVSGQALGTVLEISRWDLSKPSNCQNLVVLGVKSLAAFDKAAASTGDGRNSVPEEVRRIIEERLESCKIDSRA